MSRNEVQLTSEQFIVLICSKHGEAFTK